MQSARFRLVLALGVAAAVLGATVAASRAPAGLDKLDRALQATLTGEVQAIVRAQPGQRTVVRAHLPRTATVLKEHPLIDAVTVKIDAADLRRLAGDDAVRSLSLDAPMIDTSAGAYDGATPSPLAATLGLPIAGATGQGVGVAVIDSGIEPSGDLNPTLFRDFTDAAGHYPYDDYGHGTHVSGLIASSGMLSSTADGPLYRGVAPKARLVSLKVLDARGATTTSTVIDAIEFAVANQRALGIDVINLSLGHPILEPARTDPLVQAVEAASRAGIVVVVAAGNVGRNPVTGVPGYAGILSPANADSAITVGAVDAKDSAARGDDSIPFYSSRGPTWYDARPKPDLVAPGQGVVSDAAAGSTLVLDYPDRVLTMDRTRAQFLRLSGTSMAAAITSGVAALVIEAGRAAGASPTPSDVKAILAYTAIPMNGYDALTQGHGAINAAGAVAYAKATASSTSIAPFTTIAGDVWPWSQTTTFPPDLVWGDGGDVPAWAQTIVWGTTVNGNTIVWGTNSYGDTIVWGTNADGDTIVWGTTCDGDTIVWGTTIDPLDAATWADTAPKGAS